MTFSDFPSAARAFLRARRARKRVKDALTSLRTAYGMDRDRLPEEICTRLRDAIAALKSARSADERTAALAQAEEADRAREAALGGKPRFAALFPLVETLCVAFGVAMAFRAYCFQPFKIPTGSMQPTLYGMHSEPCDRPDFCDRVLPLKVVKFLLTGRWYIDATAPAAGTLAISTDRVAAPGMVLLSLAGKTFKIPQDAMERDVDIRAFATHMADNPATPEQEMARGVVRKGQRVWSGYTIAGDQVFVNRFAWNLRPPRRDEIVVFATSSRDYTFSETVARDAARQGADVFRIPCLGPSLYLVDRPIRGLATSQHYIKRLVGLPGETVSIDPPFLVIDGARVSGLPGIDRESSKALSATGPAYDGYHNTGDAGLPDTGRRTFLAKKGDEIRLGREFLPMGDNTRNSYDGRYWGPVPERQMRGPAALVYWPLSVRWGLPR